MNAANMIGPAVIALTYHICSIFVQKLLISACLFYEKLTNIQSEDKIFKNNLMNTCGGDRKI